MKVAVASIAMKAHTHTHEEAKEVEENKWSKHPAVQRTLPSGRASNKKRTSHCCDTYTKKKEALAKFTRKLFRKGQHDKQLASQ